MERYELQRLRDLPIEGVAEQLGLRVTRHKSLCPFHDDTHPSLSFNTRRNTFRCFVCDAHGGTIDLTMRLLNKNFLEACQWLAGDGGLSLTLSNREGTGGNQKQEENRFDTKRYERFFNRPFLSEAARRFLFEERHLDPRVVRWCRLTSWRDRNGVDWLQIPYYDADGQLIGVQWRNLTPSLVGRDGERLTPRFRFPYGSHCGIYNLPIVRRLREGDELYITEGCSDCWAMLSAGHKAIAIPSATLLSQKDKEFLSTLSSSVKSQKVSPCGGRALNMSACDNLTSVNKGVPLGLEEASLSFHMYPDRDAPGERLFLQLKDILPDIVHHHLPADCKDFSDYYLKLKAQQS